MAIWSTKSKWISLFSSVARQFERDGKWALLPEVEQSSEQPAGRVQSAAARRESGGRDSGLLGGPLDPRPQSRTVRVLLVLPDAVRWPSQPPPHRHIKGRTLRRAAHPHRLHVQGRGQRRVLSAIRSAQNCRKP